MKNFQRVLILIAILFFAKTAFASIEITEIMYDVSGTDTNREWIEVYNNGSSAVDLSKWYFFSNNTKHALNPNSSSTIEAGKYAIIVQDITKFATDWPAFSGLLFDSSWTGLGNEGDSISMKDSDLNVVSPVEYSSSLGATGDGNSLQKINGTFVAAAPTPGASNSSGNSDDHDTSDNGDKNTNTTDSKTPPPGPSDDSGSTTKKIIPEGPKIITTKIIAKNIATTRVGFSIDATTIGYDKKKLDSGRFVWSFGDGMSYSETFHKPFEYSYEYAGEYVLTLSYYESLLSLKPSATDSITISVSDPQLFISKIGNATDPFIEIQNQSEYKMSLGGWVINSNTKTFKFPEGMAILAGKSVIVPSKITSFDFNDIQHLFLYAPTGSLVSTYPASKPISIPVKNSVDVSYQKASSSNSVSNVSTNKSAEIDLNDLSAAASNNKLPDNYLPLVGLVCIILIGIVAVVIAYKKQGSNDPEIVELSSSDMKIIE